MRKEYDLIRELGRGNWIDEVAGEAVLWGYSDVDPDLEARGNELARMVREIKYDSDKFYLVEAFAREIIEIVERKKERDSAFIDTFSSGEATKWPSDEWQYEFACINKIYRVRITLPCFYSDDELSGNDRLETVVMAYFKDPTFSSYMLEKHHSKSKYTRQNIWTNKYYDDNKHRLIREIVVHEHQDDSSRGFNEIFYFESLSQAVEAWTALRMAFTLDQKK